MSKLNRDILKLRSLYVSFPLSHTISLNTTRTRFNKSSAHPHVCGQKERSVRINTLNAELNPICHLLTLLGAHPLLHVSSIRFNEQGTKIYEAPQSAALQTAQERAKSPTAKSLSWQSYGFLH
jgi:hypothetical protein